MNERVNFSQLSLNSLPEVLSSDLASGIRFWVWSELSDLFSDNPDVSQIQTAVLKAVSRILRSVDFGDYKLHGSIFELAEGFSQEWLEFKFRI